MNFSPSLIAAFVALLALNACGGGDGYGAHSNDDASGSSEVKTLRIADTEYGSGPAAVAGDTLTVTYIGYLYTNGFSVDSGSGLPNRGLRIDSATTAAPLKFKLGTGAVIPGWDQGLLGAKASMARSLIIPASLAYGAKGTAAVPPNAALVFDIKVISIN